MSKRSVFLFWNTIIVPVVFIVVATCAYASGQVGTSLTATPGALPPSSWIDQDTGHRVTRLTDQPGSRGLYFNFPSFTPDGTQMVYEASQSIYLLDMNTRKSRLLASGPISTLVVSRSAPLVYFMKSNDRNVYVADTSTGELRKVAAVPTDGRISTINSDGTLLAGSFFDDPDTARSQLSLAQGIKPSKKARERVRFDAHVPMVLFTLDVRTSVITPILHTTDWLNHIQFSPTDPTLLMYCHEGPWNEVDRIWTIRTDGSNNTLIHKRSLEMRDETAGHEFWDADGKTIWYDLQAPKGQAFFLASYNTETGEQRRYQMNRRQWSIHFNGDLKSGMFCGDGGSSFGAASAPDGQWIELYHPRLTGVNDANANGTFKIGVIESERLVNLSNQDYNDEPNVHFSSDHKYVIFTSNMYGADYIYAVEVARAAGFKAKTTTKHIFSTSIADSSENVSETTIQVVDQSGSPLPNAHITIKSLDTGREVGKYLTGQDGMTTLISLDKDLHRFTVTCPDGTCSNTVKELYTAPFSGKLIIQAHANSTIDQNYTPSGKKTTVIVQTANHNALANIQFMVRTTDATQEGWYTTSRNGSALVTLSADPSIVVFFVKWTPFAYKFASVCGTTSDTSFDVIGCVQIGNSTVVTLPR
ncbi:MAG: oligogalacturonate lyase family protein [Terracidiphilus sp.]